MRKKSKIILLLLTIVVTLTFTCFGCNTVEDVTIQDPIERCFMVEVVGQEVERKETLAFNNIEYSNSAYCAEIKGVLYAPTSETKNYHISGQTVEFSQVFGDVWQAEIIADETNLPMKIFAVRSGTGNGRATKEVNCGERKITAMKRSAYGKINFLIFGQFDYMLIA